MRCVRLLALLVLLPVVFPSAVVAANLIHRIRYTLRRSTIAPPVSSSRMHRVAAIRPQPLGERVDMTQRNFEPARKGSSTKCGPHVLKKRVPFEVAPRDDRLDRVLEAHAEATLQGAIAEAWKEYERATNRSIDESGGLRTM
jgi:hypothetical protein